MREEEKLRLDKLLSHLGRGSRKEVRALIRSGRVQVAGEVRLDPGLVLDPEAQPVCLDGEPLRYRRFEHLMLHKPAGLVTAAKDARLPTVGSLLSRRYQAAGVQPVGRLDRDTTGLLLLTNDGQLAHRILSPCHHMPKVYRLTVDLPLGEDDVRQVAAGIALSDFNARPARLELLSDTEALLTLTEGKFHQVKRMMAALGKQVLRLHRQSIGPLVLEETLAPGAYRPLTAAEEVALRSAAGQEDAADG